MFWGDIICIIPSYPDLRAMCPRWNGGMRRGIVRRSPGKFQRRRDSGFLFRDSSGVFYRAQTDKPGQTCARLLTQGRKNVARVYFD